ncbi:MAG TPA: hypothetical protein VH083_15550 [Myxococcales bacterium]|jgi:hypothetical protein|nr:hypothetical protein [Myxococcales bacterium]
MRPWIVTRHEPIEELEENLWAVNGEVPGFPVGSGMLRRMSIIKLGDGRLVFYNAIPLDDEALEKVRAWGKPSILIAPIYFHTMDVHAFQEKLGLQTFITKTGLELLRPSVSNVLPLEDLPKDPTLRFEILNGTKFGEPVFTVHSGRRASLLFCDAFQNNRPGFAMGGLMFRLMGFTSEKQGKTPPFYKWRAASDKKAIQKDLLRLADTKGLARLVPSHGLIVSQDPAGVLRATANNYF